LPDVPQKHIVRAIDAIAGILACLLLGAMLSLLFFPQLKEGV
jgi:hypothetical protein